MTEPETAKTESLPTGGRNCSVDIARCAAALLVVANHASPLQDYELPILNSILLSFEYIPVPFFAMMAGYFFVCGLMKGDKMLLPFLKRLLIPYTAWSVVYYLIDFFRFGKDNAVEFLQSCFLRFFISGSVYHFWYFPAVMVSAVIVALFFKLGIEKLLLPISFLMYSVLMIGAFYYRFFLPSFPAIARISVFIQSNLTLSRIFLLVFPSFCGGYLVKLLRDRNGFIRRNSSIVTIVSAVFYAAEFFLFYSCINSLTNMFSHYFIAAAILLLLLEHPMSDKKETAEKCRDFAGHTYYAHPLYLTVTEAVYAAIFAQPVPSLLKYIVTVLLCFVFSSLIRKKNNQYFRMIAC